MQSNSAASHPRRLHSVDDGTDVTRGGDTDGVAEADHAAAELRQPSCHVRGLLRIDPALPRIAEAHRHVPANADATCYGSLNHRCGHLEGTVQARSEVLVSEALRGGNEDGDLV